MLSVRIVIVDFGKYLRHHLLCLVILDIHDELCEFILSTFGPDRAGSYCFHEIAVVRVNGTLLSTGSCYCRITGQVCKKINMSKFSSCLLVIIMDGRRSSGLRVGEARRRRAATGLGRVPG